MSDQNKLMNHKSEKAQDMEYSNLQKKIDL